MTGDHTEYSTPNEIYEKLYALKQDADIEEYQYHLFDCKYKWEIGINIREILYEDFIKNHLSYFVPASYSSEMEEELWGYPLLVNYKDKNVIKLWREVE